jgi:hypothetical protein
MRTGAPPPEPGPMQKRYLRPAVTIAAALAGLVAALAPAAPAAANHTPAEITSFGCAMATNTSFDCYVTAVVYYGWATHTRWYINGVNIPAYQYQLNIHHSCGAGSQVTVRVDLVSYWNACWCVRDSAQTTFECRRRGNF